MQAIRSQQDSYPTKRIACCYNRIHNLLAGASFLIWQHSLNLCNYQFQQAYKSLILHRHRPQHVQLVQQHNFTCTVKRVSFFKNLRPVSPVHPFLPSVHGVWYLLIYFLILCFISQAYIMQTAHYNTCCRLLQAHRQTLCKSMGDKGDLSTEMKRFILVEGRVAHSRDYNYQESVPCQHGISSKKSFPNTRTQCLYTRHSHTSIGVVFPLSTPVKALSPL